MKKVWRQEKYALTKYSVLQAILGFPLTWKLKHVKFFHESHTIRRKMSQGTKSKLVIGGTVGAICVVIVLLLIGAITSPPEDVLRYAERHAYNITDHVSGSSEPRIISTATKKLNITKKADRDDWTEAWCFGYTYKKGGTNVTAYFLVERYGRNRPYLTGHDLNEPCSSISTYDGWGRTY